jgi:uridine kinase
LRSETLNYISEIIISKKSKLERTLLVGIDGSDGSGKSTFARELSEILEKHQCSTNVCSIDDFHNPKEIRYRQGKNSPLGFFEDSYNNSLLVEKFLLPLLNGAGTVTSHAFDCEADQAMSETLDVSSIDVILFEGMFLHRDALVDYWDISLYLKTEFSVSVPRGNARFGLNPNPGHESNARYVEGNRIYQRLCNPFEKADIVLDNNCLASLNVICSQFE